MSWKNLGNYVIGSFLFSFIVGVGTLLLVIPGIIWGLQYCMYGYYIVTQGAGSPWWKRSATSVYTPSVMRS